MTRVDVPIKDPVVIPQDAFEADWKRGYAVTIFNPERREVIKDQRTGKSATRVIPADLNYCCMECQYATLNLEHMNQHRFHGEHPWEFGPFKNPYGHIADVVVAGIDDYQEYINSKKENV